MKTRRVDNFNRKIMTIVLTVALILVGVCFLTFDIEKVHATDAEISLTTHESGDFAYATFTDKNDEVKHMLSKAQESVVWGNGTKIFTFPYEVGTYETLPLQEWIYNEGEERTPQPNLYTCPGKCLQGWIFDADRVLFDGEELKQGAKELLHYLKERKVMMSAFSAQTTDNLIQKVKNEGIYDCFKLLMGVDALEEQTPYLNAAQKSEDAFNLDHIYKYVVVCDSIEVVKAVIKDGFKTLIVTNGEDISEELNLKCWHTFESLDTIYDFFELKKVYFE